MFSTPKYTDKYNQMEQLVRTALLGDIWRIVGWNKYLKGEGGEEDKN